MTEPSPALSTVPHLTTALTGPLLRLETQLLQAQVAIEGWFREQFRATPAPVYCSVDLRNAGFKLAPVDTNLFPAGFNNLGERFLPLCVQAMQVALERVCPRSSRVLLVPESHTRNLFYLENVAALRRIVEAAGYAVRIGSLLADLAEPQTVKLPSGASLLLEPIQRHGNRVGVAGFDPCFVLLNNDLSAGRPAILEGIEQTIVPPMALGWSSRRKSVHFGHYRDVAREFGARIDLDPWFIDPYFRQCGQVDFLAREGEQCLAGNVEVLLESIRRKYREYGIDREPFVIIKADAGSYGMGVMTARSVDDVRDLNRKERKRMAASKDSRAVREVIIQEGVYTFETVGDPPAVAEPVVYMIDQHVVGGFYRVHTERGPDENLNAPGMHFEPLAFVEPCNTPDCAKAPDAAPNRFYAYGVVARLALLAAAREMAAHG
ncbi:glutamate--cysteine ligase [Immundisolibacter sp.]|uniref:glutamate--cysteine ligase n=1 Tax=Immundisolibacter sp. TaxID=1934948 RepID=UPI00260E12AD|nr:glutamate--cysteine ligase [Immundisolibacter sp.]MDD3651753.1 glutamate--cysteine ligase [Immundisolibacter sp.]